jgi:signal recognition particle receptor subunit beta
MAVVDRARNVVVLRIVYDGAAETGKTTTVRALSERFHRPTTSPEVSGERTLFFDWLDYTGGLFEGYQLRCQIVSVPGQEVLAHRRSFLLDSADVVVHVAAFADANVEPATSAVVQLVERMRAMTPVPVGVVVQANKRDAPDALSLERIKDTLSEAGARVAVVETVATTGDGVRECFVLAVRLALDRIRELIRLDSLPEGQPPADDAAALLQQMRADESVAREPSYVSPPPIAIPLPASAPAQEASIGDDPITPRPAVHGSTEVESTRAGAALVAVMRHEHEARRLAPASALALDLTPPATPDASVPSGMIWPPIEGRMHLADAASTSPSPTHGQGGWWASTERGWRFYSPMFALYADPEEGRNALIHLARAHAAHGDLLSAPRCVVLAPDGRERWRLWQIARERVSLRERLAASLDERDPARIARLLTDTALRLMEMDERIRRSGNGSLRATLDSVGVFAGNTQYVGLSVGGAASEPTSRLVMEQEMSPVLRDWASRRGELLVAMRRASLTATTLEASVMSRLGAMLER